MIASSRHQLIKEHGEPDGLRTFIDPTVPLAACLRIAGTITAGYRSSSRDANRSEGLASWFAF
jgi:hypothetical protein